MWCIIFDGGRQFIGWRVGESTDGNWQYRNVREVHSGWRSDGGGASQHLTILPLVPFTGPVTLVSVRGPVVPLGPSESSLPEAIQAALKLCYEFEESAKSAVVRPAQRVLVE